MSQSGTLTNESVRRQEMSKLQQLFKEHNKLLLIAEMEGIEEENYPEWVEKVENIERQIDELRAAGANMYAPSSVTS
jgi:DhnA family fructose-bisphosphate aldolase class Ia